MEKKFTFKTFSPCLWNLKMMIFLTIDRFRSEHMKVVAKIQTSFKYFKWKVFSSRISLSIIVTFENIKNQSLDFKSMYKKYYSSKW